MGNRQGKSVLRRTAAPMRYALLVLLAGLALAAVAGLQLDRSNRLERQTRFQALTDHIVDELQARLGIYATGLRGARGAVIAAGDGVITRESFREYSRSRDYPREFPGVRGYGYIQRVARDDEAAFLQAARQDGAPGFAIHRMAPHDGDRFVIRYIEPEANNREAVGLDIASEANRRTAAVEAARSGMPTLTDPITLVQDTSKPRHGFLLLLPIYRAGAAVDTPQQRWLATSGWSVAPISIDEVLGSFDLPGNEYSLALWDDDDAQRATPFYSTQGYQRAAAAGLAGFQPITAYGQQWTVGIKAQPLFVARLNQQSPLVVAGAITAMSLLLSALLYFYLLNRQRHQQVSLDQARMAAMVESSNDAILAEGTNGVVTHWNRAAQRMFGYSPEEAVGTPLRELIGPPDDKPDERDIFREILDGRTVPSFACQRRHRDGHFIDVLVSASPILGSNGSIVGVSHILHDITDRLRAEARVLELNATLEQQVAERTAQIRTYSLLQRAILAHAGYAIIATDNNGIITLFNPAAEVMLGYSADEMLGKQTTAVFHDPEELAARADTLSRELAITVEASFEAVVAKSSLGRSDTNEWTFVRKDGSRLPVLLTVSTLRDESSQIIGYLGLAVDLTERKSREQQLRQAMSAAESANRYKSDFLANMSHEIRTPMNAILGMVYLLEKSELPPAAQDMARKINASARSLLAIINDVLDFSKIEAGRIELENEPFDLGEVLENMATLMSSAVGTKPVEMVVSPPPPGARCLRGDALRLGQVLINLVGNAIKFTERGEVVLSVRKLKNSEPGEVRLAFSVRDTGIGIPKEKQDLIFSPFNQVDTSTTRNFGGSGLGLTISRRLVNLMGGELQVDSKPGQGSEFSFIISLELDESLKQQDEHEQPHQVLIADDHDLARENLVAIIQSFGWNVQAVESGEAAIAAAAQVPGATGTADSYDIILLDWRMPHVDGLAAAEAIRKQAGPQRQPIIIMVTAHERKLLEQNLKDDVIDAVLTKPATASSLFNVIMDSLAKRGRRPGPRKRAKHHAQRLTGLHLLVVDDSDINREVAQRILQGEGAIVELASDGRDALECIASDPSRFHLVLMDVQMPEMDGYDATRHIRQDPAMAGLPVVALTAGAFKRQEEAALAAGMDGFVAKPFEVDELVEVITQFAPTRSRSMQSLERLVAEADTTPVANEEGPDPQLLDVQRGLEYWREEAPYRKYLLQFGRSYLHAAQEIGRYLEEGDTEAAIAYAHKMRGAAGSLALPTVASITMEIENVLRGAGEVSDLLSALQLALRETAADIAAYAGDEIVLETSSPENGESYPSGQVPLLRQRLQDLLQSLDSDDPAQIEQALPALRDLVPEDWLLTLQRWIDEFDFRAAEVQVNALLAALPEAPATGSAAPA
jgi:PAS domain S-box-containing protein